MRKTDMIKELENGMSIYDFICRHSYEMSREEIADIVREMDYAMWSLDRAYSGLVSYEEFHDEFMNNLKERWEDYIAEELEEEEEEKKNEDREEWLDKVLMHVQNCYGADDDEVL